MKIAIDVAGFTPAGSDGFRRAMGTWRSTSEMEKLHAQFVEGCIRVRGVPRDDAEELFRQCAAFASFGFAKSHAAAFARTAYESAFLKLFYPAQFVTGLVNASRWVLSVEVLSTRQAARCRPAAGGHQPERMAHDDRVGGAAGLGAGGAGRRRWLA